MEFLTGDAIKTKLQRLSRHDAHARYAVAFWGKGALEMAALAELAAPATIVCDARSGACNPDELERILAGGHAVWTLDGLHSKVYLTSKGVLVGSANASANGLGHEGFEAGSVEAVIFSSDSDLMAAADRFIAEAVAKSDRVIREMMPVIRGLWRQHRRKRPLPPRRPLLQAVAERPEAFEDRGLRVIAYHGVDAAVAVHEKFESVAEDHYSPADLGRYIERGELPFYCDDTDWDIAPGDTFVDFVLSDNQTATFQGLWRVREEDAFHAVGSHGRIILLDRLKTFEGFSFDAAQASRVGRLVDDINVVRDGAADAHGDVVDLSILDIVQLLQTSDGAASEARAQLPLLDDEWILLLDLYLRFRPVRLGANRPEVIAISRVLKAMGRLEGRSARADFRTAAGLARELDVLRHLDGLVSADQARHSEATSAIWARFARRPAMLAQEVDRVRQKAIRPPR